MADAPEDEDSMPSKTSRAGSSSKAKLDGFRASAKSTPAPAKPKPTSTPRSLSTPSASTSKGKGKDAEGGETRYPWLATLRDAQQRLESDPDYDPRTLYIPPAAFNKLTDFEKQFWEIKAKHVCFRLNSISPCI